MSVNRRRGFVLIAMAAAMFLLLAVIGLAFDFGRIFIARNEAQIFADAGSMAAAAQLDGTTIGLSRARAAVARLPNRWNVGTEDFRDVMVEFSADSVHWEPEPKDPAAIQYTRVTAPNNQVEITFLRAAGGPDNFTVPARAVASIKPVRLTQ